MSTAFDALAPEYRRLWSDAPRGASQRTEVWRHIDPLFLPGDRLLDLGCGVGDDALHLAERGVRVLGIDASLEMMQIARARGVHTRLLAFENLDRLEGPYSGAISNFGALNCIADLPFVARELARLIRPNGALAICIMGRFAPVDGRHFAARWRGHARWRGMDIFYYSARQVRAAFRADFLFQKRCSIGWGDHQLYIFRRTG